MLRHMLAAALITPFVATATPVAAATYEDFVKTDVNGDARVDFTEIQAYEPGFAAEWFKDADANHDGSLTAEEFLASMPASEHNGVWRVKKDGVVIMERPVR